MSDNSPLSVDQALGLLPTSEPEEAPARAAEAPEPDAEPLSEAEPTADDAAGPEGATGDDDGAAETEVDPETVDMPRSWAAEKRELWNSMSKEAQEYNLDRQTVADRATQKAVQEAAEARKTAETETGRATQLRDVTAEVLQRAAQTFAGKWDNVDWQKWSQDDPTSYVQGKAQFDAEQAQLARISAVNQHQQSEAWNTFQRDKVQQIEKYAPALADKTHGRARITELETTLKAEMIEAGENPDIMANLSAFAIGKLWKAHQWDKAQKSATHKQPIQARPAVRPTAAQPGSSTQRAKADLTARFNKSGSIEDAIALM